MAEPTDKDEIERKKRSGSESDLGSATTEIVRASSDGMVARSDETIVDEVEAKKKKRTEGEGDGSAAAGTGYKRASGEGVVRLTVEQTKQVWADFRALDLNEVVAAIAEFCSEFPARASANLSVAWNGSYAVINMAIKFGQDVATAVRERTRESAVQVRKRYGINIKFKGRTGMAVTTPNPQAGLT